MLSPARGVSGSSFTSTSRSPAWSASEGAFDLLHATKSATVATMQLMLFFMTALCCLRKPDVCTYGALQFRKPLLVSGEMHREVHLVHAQLARTVEHHGEIGSPRRVARFPALQGLTGDGNELVVQVDVMNLGEHVGTGLR